MKNIIKSKNTNQNYPNLADYFYQLKGVNEMILGTYFSLSDKLLGLYLLKLLHLKVVHRYTKYNA